MERTNDWAKSSPGCRSLGSRIGQTTHRSVQAVQSRGVRVEAARRIGNGEKLRRPSHLRQRRRVPGDSIVGVVSAQLATQRRVLLGRALVPIPSAPLTDFSQRSAEFELSKAIVTLRRGKVRAQPLTNIACNVRQSSRRPRVRRHQRSTRTAAPCARSATPDLPVTDHILTPSTDARRPRCASPPDPRPTSFLCSAATRSRPSTTRRR